MEYRPAQHREDCSGHCEAASQVRLKIHLWEFQNLGKKDRKDYRMATAPM